MIGRLFYVAFLSSLLAINAFASNKNNDDCGKQLNGTKQIGSATDYITENFANQGWQDVSKHFRKLGNQTFGRDREYNRFLKIYNSQGAGHEIAVHMLDQQVIVGKWLSTQFIANDPRSRTDTSGYYEVTIQLKNSNTVINSNSIIQAYLKDPVLIAPDNGDVDRKIKALYPQAQNLMVQHTPYGQLKLNTHPDVSALVKKSLGADVRGQNGDPVDNLSVLKGQRILLLLATETEFEYLTEVTFESYSEESERMSPGYTSNWTVRDGSGNPIKINGSEVRDVFWLTSANSASFTLIE